MSSITEKVCNRCLLVKSLGEFYKHPFNKDGYDNRCKPCFLELQKERRRRREKGELPYRIIDEKVCSRCKQKKPVSQFSIHNGMADRLNSYCKECRRPSLKRITSNRKGFVYFVQSVGGEAIKIGFAKDVRKRLRALQGASPYQLKVLLVLEGGQKFETELHRKFKKSKLMNEWYKPSTDLIDFIKSNK